jgi:ribose 5-phosphate isomerase B
MQFKKIGISSDHAARDLKQMIIDFVNVLGAEIEIVDYGVGMDVNKSVDYPDYAALVSEDVSKGKLDGGICICGTGIGMSIAANKFQGIRATLVWDDYSAKMSREHNNSNVLCLGARSLNHHRAVDIVKIWLETPFGGDRHQMRLDKITDIENKNFKLD